MENNKRKRILFIIIVEIIAILLVINALFVGKLDRTIAPKNTVVPEKTRRPVIEETQTMKPKKILSGNLVDVNQDKRIEEAKKLYQSEKKDILILVNKDHVIPEDYQVKISTYTKQEKKVATTILDPLEKMIKAGEQEGLSFSVCSAYRSNEYQKKIFERDVERCRRDGLDEEAAYEKAATVVMPAGYSEHATGLAVDIISQHNSKLNATQEDTKEFQWLKKNCYKYGFILRYPKDKSKVTGVIYEPWHFRYVGKKIAKFITKNNLAYEEFIDMVNNKE